MPHKKILETPAASSVLKIEPTLCRLRIVWQITNISFFMIQKNVTVPKRSLFIGHIFIFIKYHLISLVFKNKTDGEKDDAGKDYDRADGDDGQTEPRRQKRENGKAGNSAGDTDNYGQPRILPHIPTYISGDRRRNYYHGAGQESSADFYTESHHGRYQK